MKNNWTINDYQIVKDQNLSNHLSVILILISVIGIFYTTYKFKFQTYESYQLLKEKDEYLLLVNLDQFNHVTNHNELYINHKKHKYKITQIEEEYSIIDNKAYQKIHISLFNYNTKASIVESHLLITEQTLFERITEFIKGGVT